jgi:hypothetical protein
LTHLSALSIMWQSPSREVSMRALVVLLMVSLPLLGPLPAIAAEVVLALDGLSHFSFGISKASALLPASARIPARINRASADSWTLFIPAAGFDPPAVAYPSGRSVKWRLSHDATGSLRRVRGEGLSVAITLPLVAHVDGAREGVAFPLTFTTEQVSHTAMGTVASREGAKLDPTSGYLQLVAAGASPAGAKTAPGEPFVAVVSARIEGLPPELLSP